MASLFQETKTESIEIAHAKFLRSIIVEKLKKGVRWSSSNWAEEFRRLRRKVGEDQISAVLAWFDSNCLTRRMPAVESAVSFHRHFDRLVDLMGNEERKKVQISDEAEAVTDELLALNWSQVSAKDLKAAVQISLDNYERFFQIVKSLFRTRQQRHEQQGEVRRGDYYLLFLEFFFKGYCKSADHFVEQWMRYVHKHFDQWDGWNGNVIAQAWSFDNDRCRHRARTWARQQGHLETDWDQFVQDVTNESGTQRRIG